MLFLCGTVHCRNYETAVVLIWSRSQQGATLPPGGLATGTPKGQAQQPPGPLPPSFGFEGHNPRENNLFRKAYEVEQKQASSFHRKPETMGHVIIWILLFILTSPLAVFLSYLDISWKYNMKLRSIGKTRIIKHNYIDLWFWLVTRFINLSDIIMSWIC